MMMLVLSILPVLGRGRCLLRDRSRRRDAECCNHGRRHYFA
jgi:hypothetical protein